MSPAALLEGLAWSLVGYGLLLHLSLLGLTLIALADFGSYRRRLAFAAYDESFGDPLARGVSVVIPAYDEAGTIVETVQAMTTLRYPDFEVVVVDDGSRDGTGAALVEAFGLREAPVALSGVRDRRGEVLGSWIGRRGTTNVVLVGTEHAGRADAVNTGIDAARKELVCLVDADTVLDPDALLHVARPFADDPGRVLASGGVVRLLNGCEVQAGRVTAVAMPRSWLGRLQVVEQLRTGMVEQVGCAALGCLLLPSAVTLYRKDRLVAAGAMRTDLADGDVELVARLHRWAGDHSAVGRVVLVSEPVAWTAAPEAPPALRRRYGRGQRGLTQAVRRHLPMTLRPRYGAVGLVAMPWVLLFRVLGPFVELAAAATMAVGLTLVGLDGAGVASGLIDPRLLALLLASWVLLGVVISWAALLAEELSFRGYRGGSALAAALAAGVLENVAFRWVRAWWRVRGVVRFGGRPAAWHNEGSAPVPAHRR